MHSPREISPSQFEVFVNMTCSVVYGSMSGLGQRPSRIFSNPSGETCIVTLAQLGMVKIGDPQNGGFFPEIPFKPTSREPSKTTPMHFFTLVIRKSKRKRTVFLAVPCPSFQGSFSSTIRAKLLGNGCCLYRTIGEENRESNPYVGGPL